MPAPRRQRGATAIQDPSFKSSLVKLPRKYLLAGIGLIVALLWALYLQSASYSDIDQQQSYVDTILVSQPVANLHVIEQEWEPTEPPPPPEFPWTEQTVERGDNLSLIFARAGFSDRDVFDIVSQAEEGKSLERIFPGQTIAFQAEPGGDLLAVRHKKSPLESTHYQRTDLGFISKSTARTPEMRPMSASGVIESSLFLAGQEAGLSQNVIMELANIFGGVIDFILDPRKGDTFNLVYEEQFLDGQKLGDGKILAASFTNAGDTFNAYRYEDSKGDIGYFNQEGVSMRKAFLMAPVDFTRISSNFNPRRLHPIYKTYRPHRGTDYAAPRGTPVFAAGDGRISKSGYSKANGNYVYIQHGEQYETKYLHLHKRHVKRGDRVKQSEIIGTVGSTGASTAPHLHYEFLLNGVHRNPRTIHKQLPKAKSLPQAELARFDSAIRVIASQLAALRSGENLGLQDTAQTKLSEKDSG